jgi:hypothetical protein
LSIRNIKISDKKIFTIKEKEYDLINDYFVYLQGEIIREKITKVFKNKNKKKKSDEDQLTYVMRQTLNRLEIDIDTDRFNTELTKNNDLLFSITENSYEVWIQFKRSPDKDSSKNIAFVKMLPPTKICIIKYEKEPTSEIQMVYIKTPKFY